MGATPEMVLPQEECEKLIAEREKLSLKPRQLALHISGTFL
jgi:hypothetical protein